MTSVRVALIVTALLVMSLLLESAHIVRAVQVQPGSLCARTEKVIFSCAVKPSGKIVSLCSSKELTKDRGYLQYRFGRPAKIELEYPASREQTQKQFQYSHYFRAQVDLTEISFTSGDFSYTIFDSYNGEEKPVIAEEGVTVARSSGKETRMMCGGRAKADFGDLGEVLPQQ